MTPLLHPGADPSCPTCRGLGLRVVRDGLVARAAPCTCLAATCPACKGTGFVSSGQGFRAPVRRCACQLVALRGRRLDAACVPAMYAESRLTNFDPGLGGSLAVAHRRVIAWLDAYDPGGVGQGLILHGPVGRGKTHLVVGLLRELVLRHGVSARFVEFSHLLGDLKMSFGIAGATAELLEPLVTCDVLVIDELGKGRNTEFEGTVLDELVSRRYNAGAVILGTTNYAPKPPTGRAVANLAEGPGGVEPTLPDRVGERVFSRLKERCAFVEVTGPEDYRVIRQERERPKRPRAAGRTG